MGIRVVSERIDPGEVCFRCGHAATVGMNYDRNVGQARCTDWDACDARRIENQANGRRPNDRGS
jgi:hypothetical protein